MTYEEIILQVSKELNLPEHVINKAYRSAWKFISEKIRQMPLKEQLTEEEFRALQTSFNLPSLGKLYCSYTQIETVNNLRKND